MPAISSDTTRRLWATLAVATGNRWIYEPCEGFVARFRATLPEAGVAAMVPATVRQIRATGGFGGLFQLELSLRDGKHWRIAQRGQCVWGQKPDIVIMRQWTSE